MTAFLIVGIVFCGLGFLLNLLAFVGADDEAGVIGLFNLIPLGLAIVALSIGLGNL